MEVSEPCNVHIYLQYVFYMRSKTNNLSYEIHYA